MDRLLAGGGGARDAEAVRAETKGTDVSAARRAAESMEKGEAEALDSLAAELRDGDAGADSETNVGASLGVAGRRASLAR